MTTENQDQSGIPQSEASCPQPLLDDACDNRVAWRLGRAVQLMSHVDADYIGTGLALLRVLRAEGFGVVEVKK